MSTEGLCLITGATGFVGSHLAEACVQRGLGDRNKAAFFVNQSGFFRIEIRNMGPNPNRIVLSTN